MIVPLDQEFIAELLKKEQEKATGITQGTTGPRPVQFGPLKWYDKSDRCASRGCGSPTLIKVSGIPYCSTHSLQILNRMIIELEHTVDLSACSCSAGVHSMGNLHTSDCTLYTKDPNAVDMSNLL